MSPLDMKRLPVADRPFPYVRHDRFIEPALYAQARNTFPACPPSTGPTGFSLYWGDEGYDRLREHHPCWQALFDSFHSQAFIDWAIDQFSGCWESQGCRIDLGRALYVPYREDRIDKELPALRKPEHAPHELWVRMDIYQGRVGYTRAPHLDHSRRLLSMLVYMCDQDELGMKGGEFVLHPTWLKRWTQPSVTIKPRENLMLAFPCSNRSYHSVPRIEAAERPRNYLQIQISSSLDAWSRRPF